MQMTQQQCSPTLTWPEYYFKYWTFCTVHTWSERVESELNQLLFKFLWNSTDKVTLVSAINKYEEGGLKMTDLNCMVKSLILWDLEVFEKTHFLDVFDLFWSIRS